MARRPPVAAFFVWGRLVGRACGGFVVVDVVDVVDVVVKKKTEG